MSSTRSLVVAVFAIAALGCGWKDADSIGPAAEATPPPVEADLAPGSRLVGPRADELAAPFQVDLMTNVAVR